MAGCGRLSAGVRNPDSHPDGSGGSVRGVLRRFRRCPTPAARWPVTANIDRIARPPSRNCHRRGARQPVQMAIVQHVSDTDGRCGTVADTRCPQRGLRTGRCPPAEPPADMTVETAAEGLQRFRPGGSYRTGYRTPDRSRSHRAGHPRPPAGRRGHTRDRTPEAADGQSADRVRVVTTSSTPPQGQPAGGRLRRPSSAGNDTTGPGGAVLARRVQKLRSGGWPAVRAAWVGTMTRPSSIAEAAPRCCPDSPI